VISSRRHSWRDARFVVLDFETTGLDPTRDHVLSFGAVPVVQGRVRLSGALYGVVRPPVSIPAESIRVHGIRPADLEHAPALDEIAGELLAQLEGRALVAHAAGIELAFLEHLPRGRGVRLPSRAIDVLGLAAELARRGHPARPRSPRLADLAEAYRVPVARTHHALGDALTTAQLFLVLAGELELRGRGSGRELGRAGRSQNARSFVADLLDRTGPIA
jgi:DNA polymerase-3 subunit epsilon